MGSQLIQSIQQIHDIQNIKHKKIAKTHDFSGGSISCLSPSIKQIWKGTRHKDISQSIHFLWILIHNGYKVGRHWNKILGSEHFGICSKCNAEESMNHILTECKENGQQQVWSLSSHLWLQKTKQPLKLPISEIMACGVIKKGTKPGATDKATSWLYCILVSESVHLIWWLWNPRQRCSL
ncbi:hypothetical protein B0H19DRAFT_919356 [Mycena capillaripes]|nr:hypothetical protein B0H19DRAFT_919356 [Mycena capillaripes]